MAQIEVDERRQATLIPIKKTCWQSSVPVAPSWIIESGSSIRTAVGVWKTRFGSVTKIFN